MQKRSMASNDSATTGNDFTKVMETFPCLFNVGMLKKPSHTRLQLLAVSLENDIGKEEEEFEGQKLNDVNVLTWVYFQLGNIEEALSKNDEALTISTDNLVALGNRAFLEWYRGSDLSIFLEHLERLKLDYDFPEKRMEAKSFQAKLLFRLGGTYNMSSSIQLYRELIEKGAENFEWKYQYCLGNRRLMTMSRNSCEERNVETMFRDIAENATDVFWKSSAMCELAVLLASNNGPVRAVEELVEKALNLARESPVVLRKCGMALTKQGNPRGIALLEESVSLKENTVTQHALAKCYTNNRLIRNLDRGECDRKAARNFQASYDLSRKENTRPLIDLAFLYVCRKRFDEALEIYKGLIHDWSLHEIYYNPFMIAKISEGFYKCLQKTGGRRHDPFYERYLCIALSTGIEQFKRTASSNDISLLFDLIVNPSARNSQNNAIKNLVYMMNDSNSNQSARQILLKLQMQQKLNIQCIAEETEHLLDGDRPGEALLMFDIAELHMHDQAKELQKRAMVEEAKWQLSQGLISCKMLFHKLFTMYHSNFQPSERLAGDDDDNSQTPVADVLILQDGHHWRPFLQDNTGVGFDVIEQNQMYEDVLQYLFDLEPTSNPCVPFSGGSQPDREEFSALLKQFNVRLVLLVIDENTTKEFFQMIDFLLPKSLEAKEADFGIVYSDGDIESKARDQMPNLVDKQVRCFKAMENGFLHQNNSKPVTDLIGTELLDVYFSGNVDNAMEFFNFLAPY